MSSKRAARHAFDPYRIRGEVRKRFPRWFCFDYCSPGF